MFGHIDPLPAKSHSLRLQAEALIEGVFRRDFDLAPSAKDTMPGQPDGMMQNPGNLPRISWISRCTGNCAVSRNFPAGNPAYGSYDSRTHWGSALELSHSSALREFLAANTNFGGPEHWTSSFLDRHRHTIANRQYRRE